MVSEGQRVHTRPFGRRFWPLVLPITALALGAACTGTQKSADAATYLPRTRAIAVTTVSLLVREAQVAYPFLKPDFAKDGVVEGDTIHFTFINPEDDVHSFVLPDFAVLLPPQKVTEATYVAKHRGIFPIVCSVAKHLPMMSGQLVVLAPSAIGQPDSR